MSNKCLDILQRGFVEGGFYQWAEMLLKCPYCGADILARVTDTNGIVVVKCWEEKMEDVEPYGCKKVFAVNYRVTMKIYSKVSKCTWRNKRKDEFSD